VPSVAQPMLAPIDALSLFKVQVNVRKLCASSWNANDRQLIHLSILAAVSLYRDNSCLLISSLIRAVLENARESLPAIKAKIEYLPHVVLMEWTSHPLLTATIWTFGMYRLLPGFTSVQRTKAGPAYANSNIV